MKSSYMKLFIAGWILLLLISGCSSMEKKSNDIPVNTQSKEAQENFRKGLQSLDQNDTKQARTYFMKAIEADPKLAIACLFKSVVDLTPKEFADDVDKAKSNLEGVSNWEKMYYDFTLTFLNSDWDKRLKIAQEIAGKNPEAPRPQVDLGTTYLAGNQPDKARTCFQKAIDLDPNWVGGYAAMINAYLFFEPKDFKKAENNGLKAVNLAPSSPGMEIALGDCYRAENELEKARDCYSKAIQLDPNSPDAYYKKGNADTFLGNMDAARHDFMDGSKYDQSATGAIPFIAYTYLYSGDPKTAEKTYMDAIANLKSDEGDLIKTNFAKSLYLQDCASIATFYNDAAKLKELIPQIEPLSIQIGNDLGTDEAKLSQKGAVLSLESLSAALDGKYEDAKAKAEEIKKTLEPLTDPTKLDGYEFALGFIAYKQKNFADAVAHFEKTQQISVYNKYWLATAYEANGNKDKANALYKEIVDYNFNGIEFALVRNEVKKKVASL